MIVTFKISQKEIKLIHERVVKFGDCKISECKQLKDLLSIPKDEISALFMFVDETITEKGLIEILTYFEFIPVNLIFKNKNFDLLLIAFKYNVNAVFEGEMNAISIENALMKIEVLNQSNNETLPVLEILNLFSRPVKIKTESDLFYRLSGYFRSFHYVKNYSLITIEDEELSVLGEQIKSEHLKEIKDINYPRQYIGKENQLMVNEDNWFITPVLILPNKKVWLAISLAEENKNFVLNTLFYKFLENVLIYRMNKMKEEDLKILATTDEVTGLYNQRKLSLDLESEILEHEKEHETFSLMFIDVDHFKDVNDSYGHVVGSKLLTDIGDELTLILRQSDHIYRYGGDEFVVIMPHVTIDVVHEIASRVLKRIKEKDFIIENNQIYKLSVSIGIAEYPTDAKSAVEIIKFADEMMYMSKRSGRGKVFHVGEVANANASTK